MKKTCLLIIALSLTNINIVNGQNKLVLKNTFPNNNSVIAGDYLTHPYAIELYKDNIYVLDALDNCIKVFSKEGKYISRYSQKGAGPGDLKDPFAFSIDQNDGRIYVVDQGNNRISIFRSDGKFEKCLKTFRPASDIIVQNEKIIVTVKNDAKGTLYAVYNKKGKIAKEFGAKYIKEVENNPLERMLYNEFDLSADKNNIYAFNTYMPFVQQVNFNGDVIKTIRLRNTVFDRFFDENIEGSKKKFSGGGFAPVGFYLKGGVVNQNKIYCYSTKNDKPAVYIFDMKGINIGEFKFANESNYKDVKNQILVKIDAKYFYFADVANAKIKIYEISK